LAIGLTLLIRIIIVCLIREAIYNIQYTKEGAYRPVLPFETVIYAKQTLDESVKDEADLRSKSGTDTKFITPLRWLCLKMNRPTTN